MIHGETRKLSELPVEHSRQGLEASCVIPALSKHPLQYEIVATSPQCRNSWRYLKGMGSQLAYVL